MQHGAKGIIDSNSLALKDKIIPSSGTKAGHKIIWHQSASTLVLISVGFLVPLDPASHCKNVSAHESLYTQRSGRRLKARISWNISSAMDFPIKWLWAVLTGHFQQPEKEEKK